MEELKKAKKVRASILGLLTKQRKIFIEKKSKMTYSALSVMLQLIDDYHQRHNTITQLILELSTEPSEDEDASDKESTFTNAYTDLKTDVLELMDERKFDPNNSTMHSIISPSPAPVRSVRLPKLELPRFSGKYYDWLDFKNEFDSMIIKDSNLNDVDRFRFLKSALADGPKRVISNMEVTSKNFPKAWEALMERYDHDALIFRSHINEILSLQGVSGSNPQAYRDLFDKTQSHYRSLLSLGSVEKVAENLLICLILRKLDVNAQSKWEEYTDDEIATWDKFTKFFEKYTSTLERVDETRQESKKNTTTNRWIQPGKKPQTSLITTSNDAKCPKCQSAHLMTDCPLFLALSPKVRGDEAKRLRLCIGCLKSSHSYRFCKARCEKCSRKHHTLLHSEDFQVNYQPASSIQHQTLLASQNFDQEQVLLASVIVQVKDQDGIAIPCHAILDCGSTDNYISERFAKTINATRMKNESLVGGIGNIGVKTKGICKITFGSTFDNSINFEMHASILQKITDSYPPVPFDVENWKIPSHIQLADPEFNQPKRIDLLIGGGLFWQLLLCERYSLGPDLPYLCNTKIGHIVVGPCQSSETSFQRTLHANQLTSPDLKSLNELVQRFWELDSFKAGNCLSNCNPKDKFIEEHYSTNTKRDNCGRYIVRLPFCDDPSKLGDSLGIATRRFLNLERRLDKEPELKRMYKEFIEEYEYYGHLEVVHDFKGSVPHFFLPHHCVLKMSSSSTKLRVVFDGSSKTSSGLSLNDILYSGPKLQDDLIIILQRFRLFKYVITADIQQMYRQVRIDSNDANFQLILWRSDKMSSLKVLRLLTVTYGTAPGSYLAIKTLSQLADDESLNFPNGSRLLRQNFYVDDAMFGANCIEELKMYRQELVDILDKGGFKLCKFCSNSPDVIKDVLPEAREKFVQIDEHNTIKALGLLWQPELDIFRFSFQDEEGASSITKRVVLSEVAKLFDPVGFICPVVTLAKIFFQSLWTQELNWDSQLSEDLSDKWIKFRKGLTALKDINVPRHVFGGSNIKLTQLHGFCDASEKAYGACIYMWCLQSNNEITVTFVEAKSRVAPKKTITIARLELCAAKLLVDMVDRLQRAVLNESIIERTTYWTDSTIVLNWLHNDPCRWNTFVAHRVSHIQNFTDSSQWNHIPGELNPADCITRGMLPSEISNSLIWWNGPTFLKKNKSDWPKEYRLFAKASEIDEYRPNKCVLVTLKKSDITDSMRYSCSFRGIRRAFAYVLRFVHQCRTLAEAHKIHPDEKRVKVIKKYSDVKLPTLEEEISAEEVFIKLIQRTHFSKEYDLLDKKLCVTKDSSLSVLAPFIDEKGLIRVGGRIKNAHISYDAKHQILLPKKHPFTALVINYYHHFKFCHAGPQMVLSAVRNRYWPIGGLQLTRSVTRKCIWCFRLRLMSQLMGDLPEDRIVPKQFKAFAVTGIDYAGPITVRHHIRCRQNKEVHLALFVCFVTKAVHVELVPDRTTEAFIRALKRFIADRGSVSKLYSDNATYFVGASNYFRELKESMQKDNTLIKEACDSEFIEWSFIPPRTPHQGGLWESSIKMLKRLIRNIVGQIELTEDELRTVAKQAGAIMNSRPITPMSSDPNDLEPLTPAHFLFGGPQIAVPEAPTIVKNPNSVQLAQRMKYTSQQLWNRFYEEYLQILQPRSKWRFKQNNVKVGDMVLMKVDNTDTLKWPLGKIIQISPDSEGVVRVVVIKTKNGEFKRGITQLALLPIEENTF